MKGGLPLMTKKILGYSKTDVVVEVEAVDTDKNKALHTYLVKPDPSTSGWYPLQLAKQWAVYTPELRPEGIIITVANLGEGSYARLVDILDDTFG